MNKEMPGDLLCELVLCGFIILFLVEYKKMQKNILPP